MNTDICYETLDFGRMVFLLQVFLTEMLTALTAGLLGSSKSLTLRAVTLFLWLAACPGKVVPIYNFPRAL